jgi:lipoprotein-releasing system permease protein
MKTEIYLARRYLFRGKARHVSFIGVISCLGIILGVATIIVATSIINGIDGGLMERIMRFKDHITVESKEPDLLLEVKTEVNNWPLVERASLAAQTQVFAKFEDRIVPMVVKGIDFSDNKEKTFFNRYIVREIGQEGFFIGEPLRRRFFLDQEIEFYPLQKKLALQTEEIRGSFLVGLYDIDNYYLISDLATVKSLSPNYHFFLGLKVVDPFAASKVKEEIIKSFPKDLFVSTWIETNQALFATLKLEKIAMFIILTLIVLIASFNIFATLTVKVVEKTKDIGVLKSLGFNSRKILSIFTLQGLFLGFIGTSCGTVLGLGLCFILKRYPFIRLPEEIFFTEYLPISVNPKDIFLVAAITVFISFISSLLPAARAAKLNICQALRYE